MTSRNGFSGLIAPLAMALLVLAGYVAAPAAAVADTLFFEDFEGLELGPRQTEVDHANWPDPSAVWTETPPANWSMDDSEMPAGGRVEWNGWGFALKNWWIDVAGNQERAQWLSGDGTVAIADPDEWDDQAHDPGYYYAHMSTGPISLAGITPGTVSVMFNSSWRPEGFDDTNEAKGWDGTNNQTAIVSVSFDGGNPIEILHWDSDPTPGNEYYHEDSIYIDETVLIDPAIINSPPGAQNMVLTFSMARAANDWWWAIDNIAVEGNPIPEPSSVVLILLGAVGLALAKRARG